MGRAFGSPSDAVLSSVDFPTWGWAWIAAGIVALPLLVLAVFRPTSGPGATQTSAGTPRRLHGRAMLWWGLGMMTFALAEAFESDALTWASLGAFAIGYVTLARRRAYGDASRMARVSALLGTAVLAGYLAVVGYRSGSLPLTASMTTVAGVVVYFAIRLARSPAGTPKPRG